jgi:hypothetical protein
VGESEYELFVVMTIMTMKVVKSLIVVIWSDNGIKI